MNKQWTRIVAVAVIVGILGGLAGWFFFLRERTNGIKETAAGRGFAAGTPSFGGLIGSLYENAAENLASSGTTTIVRKAGSPPPRLWRVSATPAGSLHFSTTRPHTMYYTDYGSGNVFLADVLSGEIRRVTNTLIPHAYESVWVDDTHIIFRHLGDNGEVRSFLATIETGATSTPSLAEMRGSYLPDNIVSITAHGTSSEFFTLEPSGGGFVGAVHTIGKDPRKVWQSVIGEWRAAWEGRESILLVQDAAQGVVSSAIEVHPKTGVVRLVQHGTPGLSLAANKDATVFVYSESTLSGLSTHLVARNQVRHLPFSTLGEKCIIPEKSDRVYCAVPRELPKGPLPDAWHRGEVSFSDEWWFYDIATDDTGILLSPESEFGTSVDVATPSLDPTETYIHFIDRVTGTPWVATIPE